MRRKSFVILLAAAALAWASAAFGWSFGVVGDTRDDRNGVFTRILATVADSDMEFLIHTGDLERPGGTKSWKSFRRRTAGFPKPLHVVIGNHEVRGGTAKEFAAFFGLPGSSYSFTRKNAHFVVLDNAGGRFPKGTLEWLDRELSRHPKSGNGIRFFVVAMHAPPLTDTIVAHGMKRQYQDQSERLRQILSSHKVDLVLCSHEHMHLVEEWNGIKVIVSGGGGAPMFPFQRYGFYRVDLASDGSVRETLITIPAEAPAAPAR
ncbi:MAG: metallophosphoesterase family protein [Deltaproteobacteria bacterium]